MIRLSFPQKKGGVGKTTLCKIVAEWFSQHGRRVLLVDFDDQCSLSSLYLQMERVAQSRHKRPPVHKDYDPASPEHEDWSGRSSSADIFYSDRLIEPYTVVEQGEGRLDILPADSEQLTEIRENKSANVQASVEDVIVEFFSMPEVSESYDMVIFDTGPNESALMRGVLASSTHTIIPVELEQQCVDGLDAILGLVLEEQRRRTNDNPLQLTAIQVNKFTKVRSLHRGFLAELESLPTISSYLSPVVLPNRVGFAERDVRFLEPDTIFRMRPSDPVRKSAEEFCKYVQKRLEHDGVNDGATV